MHLKNLSHLLLKTAFIPNIIKYAIITQRTKGEDNHDKNIY